MAEVITLYLSAILPRHLPRLSTSSGWIPSNQPGAVKVALAVDSSPVAGDGDDHRGFEAFAATGGQCELEHDLVDRVLDGECHSVEGYVDRSARSRLLAHRPRSTRRWPA